MSLELVNVAECGSHHEPLHSLRTQRGQRPGWFNWWITSARNKNLAWSWKTYLPLWHFFYSFPFSKVKKRCRRYRSQFIHINSPVQILHFKVWHPSLLVHCSRYMLSKLRRTEHQVPQNGSQVAQREMDGMASVLMWTQMCDYFLHNRQKRGKGIS